MSDLVKRLREKDRFWPNDFALFVEAADYIERLEAAEASAKHWNTRFKDAEAENKRLRESLLLALDQLRIAE